MSFSHRAGTGGGPVEFSLSQFPSDSYIDHDAASGITKDGSNKISAWAASFGSSNGISATSVEQPSLINTALSPVFPAVYFDGTTGKSMLFDEPMLERWYNILVLDRPDANQNAVALRKNVFASGRRSDSQSTSVSLQRTNSDLEQDDIYLSGYGGGTPTMAGVFSKAPRRVVVERRDTSNAPLDVNGISSGTASNLLAATRTVSQIGSATSCARRW